jgi:hypothetical protein
MDNTTDLTERIYHTTHQIFRLTSKLHITPSEASDRFAEEGMAFLLSSKNH